ncbi:MAG TPA: ACT domain-containing protein [Candidatus Binatia bacterium]|nr:ACT domain-containing protein [Candidatus Binatia bacterium]
MPKTTQLVLTLQSKPGVLAGISRALADARVNILSLSAAEAAGRGKIRMIVSKPTEAKRALRKARVRFVEEPAFAKRLRNKPGALARVVEKLARARVNIRSAYATTAGRGGATVVITVSNAAKARRLIG